MFIRAKIPFILGLFTLFPCHGLMAQSTGRFGLEKGNLSRKQVEEKPRPAGRINSADLDQDEKAIREAAASLSSAFNKGDLKAILGFWVNEAEYVNQDGKTYRGKGQIEAVLKRILEGSKGYKQSLDIRSIRFLKNDVAYEEGSIILSSPNGEVEKGNYIALWIKLDGKWLLASVRDLAEAREEGKAPSFGRLKPLSWLIGDWQEKDGDAVLSVRWAPGHSFLLMDWTVKRSGETIHVHQRIGWDPMNARIKSWVFDSNGGYGEAVWGRDGTTWIARNEGLFPDGKFARSLNAWKFLGKDSFQWSSRNREIDDMPLPDSDSVYIRKTEK